MMKKIFFVLAPLALIGSIAFTTSETLPIGARLPLADYQMANVKTGYFTSVKQEARENAFWLCLAATTAYQFKRF